MAYNLDVHNAKLLLQYQIQETVHVLPMATCQMATWFWPEMSGWWKIECAGTACVHYGMYDCVCVGGGGGRIFCNCKNLDCCCVWGCAEWSSCSCLVSGFGYASQEYNAKLHLRQRHLVSPKPEDEPILEQLFINALMATTWVVRQTSRYSLQHWHAQLPATGKAAHQHVNVGS